MPKAQLKTGVELYYEEHGKGTPVVLLPAIGHALDIWHSDLIQGLSSGYRLITLDTRGIGRTPCKDEFFTIDQLAADLAELLEFLNAEPAHIVGNSIGGRIGLELALNYPGRVRSLVMSGSGSGSAVRPGEDAFPMPQHRLLVRLVERGLEKHVIYEVRETESYFTDKFRAEQPESVEQFYQAAWKHHANASVYLRYVLARHAHEATHRLPFLKPPVLITVGSNDRAGGGDHFSAAKMLADRISGCEYKVLNGVSHEFFWERPDLAVEVLTDWFRRH
jgi:pimeloyl-ACP methyl ester carboxylesterase